jgi:GH35 family endo-1,4-beta-xylanase
LAPNFNDAIYADSTQMGWVESLNNAQLQQAMNRRLNSVVNRYKGQVIHWDVNNENVHFNFFETKFGPGASTKIFQQVNKIDPNAVLFLNDYNTLEQPGDWNAVPDRYLQRFHQIRSGNPNVKMGIGLESHFDVPNIPYMRAVLDKMASAGVPIWLTELDVAGTDPNQVHDVCRISVLYQSYSVTVFIFPSFQPFHLQRGCTSMNQILFVPLIRLLIISGNINLHSLIQNEN